MYDEYFGLSEAPFSIAPDPRYLYMSDQHREALAHLLYGIQSDGGFVLLTGEVGTGKTTVCRCLLEQLPKDCVVAFVINPRLNVQELLSTICDELRIAYPEGNKSIKVFVDLINAYLLDAYARGWRAVLIIDEAQNLSRNVLEQIRLLTNLETNKRKLLQIILLGQPELREKLALPELRQLSQRIIARYHLGPLTKQETALYVAHRLALAGSSEKLFSFSTLNEVFSRSGGIPRLVNMICDRALLGAYSQGKRKVDRITAARAADEVLGEKDGQAKRSKVSRWYLIGILLFVVIAASSTAHYYRLYPRSFAASMLFSLKETSIPSVSFHESQAPQVSSLQEASQAPESSTEKSAPVPSPEPLSAEAPQQPSEQPPEQPADQAGSRRSGVGESTAEMPAYASMDKLAELVQAHGQEPAYATLFGQWGAVFKPRETDKACRQAQVQGLWCFFGRGGMDDLRKWNRPAILKLLDGGGGELYATLTALEEGVVTFTVGDEKLKIPKDDVIGKWSGEYILLWRAPAGYMDNLHLGNKGPLVGWLKSELGQAHGEARDVGPATVFDNALAEEVKRFQRSNDLDADGIVGPRTLSQLVMDSNAGGPVLMERKKDP